MYRTSGKPVLTALGLAMLAALMVSLLPPFQAARPAMAQASSTEQVEELELRYDDGLAVATMKGIGCEGCHKYQGVHFTLPEGVPSAVLTSVKFYVGGGKGDAASLWINVAVIDEQPFGGDTVTQLITPLYYAATSGGWHTVSVPRTVVPSDFWVILTRKSESNMPYYDGAKQGSGLSGINRSWMGDSLDWLNQEVRGDLLIRAVVAAEVHVGPGQTFGRIQEAIDAVGAGTRIVVHDSTYTENVSVYKSVYIKSLSGPAATIVVTPFPDQDVFRITAPDATVSGLTMQGAALACGIRIDGQSRCLISGNIIQYNDIGVYVTGGSSANIILENQCSTNTKGILIDGSQNYVSGNDLHGNIAPIGSAAYLSATASGNQLRFNSIAIDPVAASVAQIYNENPGEEADAIENWWGSSSGPSYAGGERVAFEPWLKIRPLRVKTVATRAGDFAVDVRNETSVTVVKVGEGAPVVSVASFAENPADDFPGKPMGKWIDVLFSSTEGVGQAEIRLHYTDDEITDFNEGALRPYWWNGEKWKSVGISGVDKVNNIVWAKVTPSSKPSLTDLGGTFFAVGVGKSAGFSWWIIPVIIVIVILALIAVRLFWVLVIRQERY